MPKPADELRELVDGFLDELSLAPDLGGLAAPLRYVLQPGGKRIRPVLCLATGEALGVDPALLLPAAASVELVHNFSLVHDDLPALDDDAERRGRPSAHVEFGEAVAILAGDALLAEAFRLALGYDSPGVARELADATLGMIGGQYVDILGDHGDVLELHRLKTGRLFGAAVGCALAVAGVSEANARPWRRFGEEVGLLFQLVDDLADDDGYAGAHGGEATRALAGETSRSAAATLASIHADTSVLDELRSDLEARSRATAR